mmetsp:Transcript_13977/g.20874  ORF Transcript_13977/g.20874 Transcript_13977/m.20874 type:complete len:396 (-) Transcript_13977:149-1336(-)|eukprot:CAMPEP_0194089122 /NCGR_PEP_ID=MMETSP0149-20130528/32851_1 /TAXON_ID=122233 /ORGANISM="Chaetoceros debilis, Strain MM31A-1" /LENGTH=395 /DNA_ID=CAMNT_0038772943 /DNA_START=27 /DNA_END=1214 /DNA_ORIENTATION=-
MRHKTQVLFLFALAFLATGTKALNSSSRRKYALVNHNAPESRRRIFQNIIAFNSLFVANVVTSPTANASTDEGIGVVTDSSVGKAVRKSAIEGARVIDNLDEKWERFSDSLRDKNKCDEKTGRRLFDNGFRKDGTQVGNPVLGALCNPVALAPLDEVLAKSVLDLATDCALRAGAAGGDSKRFQEIINDVETLVKPSFDRTLKNISIEKGEERKRQLYNFQLYSRMRAVQNSISSPSSIRQFQLLWGQAILDMLAPNASRRDYISPFPETKDEFEDYDYDKNLLLDGLGSLKVTLDQMKVGGLLSYFEISIPYDDYGSVVTIAIDDDVSIGAEILLTEQNYSIGGPVQAITRAVMENRAKVLYSMDAFFLDPSTTKQNIYNPTQLLLSLSNLCKI